VPSRARCSDGRGSLIVIEGMRGAGKTSAVGVLQRRGRQVVGEYVTEHPSVEDDHAHQRNWIAKTAIAVPASTAGDVFCDRDFLTSLAFAYSIDDRDLLARRAAWASTHLAAGRLVIGDTYLVLDITPQLSLARRESRLSSAHPWSCPPELERLRRFYLSPLDALEWIDDDLAAAFACARWYLTSGEATTPDELAVLAERLAEEVSRWPP
jgi:thymidylate kinase